jgi:hypothetical protein
MAIGREEITGNILLVGNLTPNSLSFTIPIAIRRELAARVI